MGGAFCVRFVNGFVNGMPLTPTVSASPGCCIRTARSARRGPTRLDLRSFSRARRGTEGGPGRPAPGRAEARVQGSPRAALNGRGSRRRWLGLAGSLAAGGRRPPHLPPARPPAVTPLGACTCQNQAGASSPRRAILPPGKLAAKGVAYGRVAASLRFTSADPGLRACLARSAPAGRAGQSRGQPSCVA